MNTFKHFGALKPLAGLALVSIGLSAQETTQQDSAAAKSEVVKLEPFQVSETSNTYLATDAMTSTGIATDIINAPQNISVVTEGFIKDLHYDFVADALLYTAGVEVDEFIAYDSALGGPPRLRGFNATSYLRDGVTQPFSFLTADISRIEVILGPVSAFYGRSSPGGIINYITLKPEFVQKAKLDLTYGSYNYRTANVDYQSLFPNYNKLAFRIIAGVERSGNWREWEYVHKKYFAPTVTWTPIKMLEVRASYEWEDTIENIGSNGRNNFQFNSDWANPPLDVINFYRSKVATNATNAQVISYLQNRWNAAIATWSSDIQAVRGGLAPPTVTTGDISRLYPASVGRAYNTGGPGDEHIFQDADFDATAILTPWKWVTARYTYDYFHGLSDEYEAFGFPNGDGTIPFAPRDGVVWTNIAVNSVDVLFTKKIGPVDNKFLIGDQRVWTWSRTGAHTFVYTSLAPVVHNGVTLTGQQVALEYNPFIDPPINVQQILSPTITPAAPTQNGTFGEYAQWQADFWDERIHTQIGARQDKSIGSHYYPATPTYGVNFRVYPGFVLFGNYCKDYVVNGLDVTGPGVLPGEATTLPATYGVSKDFGIKTNWRDNTWVGTIDFFQLQETNVVSTDTIKNLEDPRNNTGSALTAVGWSIASGLWETEGINASLTWTPGPQFQVLLVYDFMPTAKIVYDPQWLPGSPQALFQDGRRLSLCPENEYKLWGKYNFRNDWLKGVSAGFGCRYTGATQGGNTAQPTQIIAMRSYTVCDALLSYKRVVGKTPVGLTFTVRNLMNHIYQQGAQDVFQDPRTMYVDMSLGF